MDWRRERDANPLGLAVVPDCSAAGAEEEEEAVDDCLFSQLCNACEEDKREYEYEARTLLGRLQRRTICLHQRQRRPCAVTHTHNLSLKS